MTALDYTFITTCKGRLHHLKQTLPGLIQTRCAKIIVVDYRCPDGTADWVESHYPQVTVVRVTDDEGFCLARARNIGALHAQSSWLVFIDADVFVHDGWDAWVPHHLMAGSMYRAGAIDGKTDLETFGTFMCERSAFERVGGYDESFSCWGGEDVDIYRRLAAAAIVRRDYPGELVSAISHGDDERTRFSDIKSTQLHRIIHEIYMRAKAFYAGFIDDGSPLSLDDRKKIMALIAERVQQWDRDGRPPGMSIQFRHKHARWLPDPYVMGVEAAINISIQDRKPARTLTLTSHPA